MRGSSKNRLNMRLARDIPALQRWRHWLGAVVIAEIGWFVLLQPRSGAPFHTLFMLALLPLTVVGYVYLLVGVSAFLSERDWDLRLRETIVLMLGFSVGMFVFALMWFTRVHFDADLS
jgi:hypothetical protein